MAYYLDLFTPETWERFQAQGSDPISGFRERQRRTAERIQPGDLFLCYLVRLSRWCGALKVTSRMFLDSTPVFADPDPFTVRFEVEPRIVLPPELSIPMVDDNVWLHLSTTRNMPKAAFGWAQTAGLRASLRELDEDDGGHLLALLDKQNAERRLYPLTQRDQRNLKIKHAIRAADRNVIVEVPSDDEEEPSGVEPAEISAPSPQPDVRESYKVQAILARVGIDMGFRVWIPRGDRTAISDLLSPEAQKSLLDVLPLNYDDATLRTVEQIDVIWLKNRSMARAFEVEHTTAIYSGLLRMADLLALQPNMDIRLHIVAPDDKREKVLREIKRPVFSLLDRGPLYESCSYISYGGVNEIAAMKHLTHMSDSILDEFEESAEDV